jgi:hypothetical protein
MTIIMPPATWTYYNETSNQSGKITITSLSPDHIEFKDIHGNTIHLMAPLNQVSTMFQTFHVGPEKL